ncbi:hypothetical protein IWZ01DRAFT_63883 [Phyllosticta capitalensis]
MKPPLHNPPCLSLPLFSSFSPLLLGSNVGCRSPSSCLAVRCVWPSVLCVLHECSRPIVSPRSQFQAFPRDQETVAATAQVTFCFFSRRPPLIVPPDCSTGNTASGCLLRASSPPRRPRKRPRRLITAVFGHSYTLANVPVPVNQSRRRHNPILPTCRLFLHHAPLGATRPGRKNPLPPPASSPVRFGQTQNFEETSFSVRLAVDHSNMTYAECWRATPSSTTGIHHPARAEPPATQGSAVANLPNPTNCTFRTSKTRHYRIRSGRLCFGQVSSRHTKRASSLPARFLGDARAALRRIVNMISCGGCRMEKLNNIENAIERSRF